MTGQIAGILALLALAFAAIAIFLALAAMATIARAARAPRRSTHYQTLRDQVLQDVINDHGTTTHRPPTHIFHGPAAEDER